MTRGIASACSLAALLVILELPVTAAEDWSPYEPLATSARSVPSIADPAWADNPIDAFVFAAFERRELHPSPEIDRRQWLRRVTFDLIGLPPTTEELAALLQDSRPDPMAYEAVVERLLASPHYGQRWARHWLDVVRYADTDGFAIDAERPRLWRYRDYVIRHFNQDRPYGQFIREQLAGDELGTGSEAIIATSFYRLGPYEADNMTPQHRQQDFLNEITTTIGTAFLGLTVGCARCHDHKYDPIPQSDFYRLQAFVKPAWRDEKTADFLPAEQVENLTSQKAAAEAELVKRRDALDAHRATLRERLACALGVPAADVPKKIFYKALKGEKVPIDKTSAQAAAAASSQPNGEQTPHVTFEFSSEEREKFNKLKQAVKAFYNIKRFDASVDSINIRPRDKERDEDEDDEEEDEKEEYGSVEENAITHVLLNGDPFAPGELVQPGCLSAVAVWSPELQEKIAATAASIQGRRSALADWIASPQNPLTMRVYVNRIWQYHFGAGIVRTANDFGVNGSGASHPELLDFLAAYFLDHGERTKPLHRLIVMSRTYRSASHHPNWPECMAIDPENQLLWHAPLRRLDAEVVRDALLSVSGQLNTQQGGPGFHERLPEGMPSEYSFFQWNPSSDQQRRRRSIYMFQRRNLVHPFMESFDVADANQSCERRSRSVTALQALAMINGGLASEASLHLAGKLHVDCSENCETQIRRLFATALGRSPSDEELAECASFLSLKTKHYSAQTAASSQTQQSPELLALRDLCLVTVNSNEFLYLD